MSALNEELLRAIVKHNKVIKSWVIANPAPQAPQLAQALAEAYIPQTPWLQEWIADPGQIHGKVEKWIRDRMHLPNVRRLMQIFPPNCVVAPVAELHTPAPHTVAYVASHREDGTIAVKQSPESTSFGAVVSAQQVVPIAYWCGLRPHVVKRILAR